MQGLGGIAGGKGVNSGGECLKEDKLVRGRPQDAPAEKIELLQRHQPVNKPEDSLLPYQIASALWASID
jgi:hypothetical protein